MNALLLDKNVVSILFNRNHRLRQTCIDAVAGHQLVISFMTRAELLLWPARLQQAVPSASNHLHWFARKLIRRDKVS